MALRIGSPPSSFSSRYRSFPMSKVISVRRLVYLALISVTFIFLYRSIYTKPKDVMIDDEDLPHFPLESGLAHTFPSRYGEPESVRGSIDDAARKELSRLKQEQDRLEQETETMKLKEAEKKQKEEAEWKKKQGDDRKKKEEEERNKKDAEERKKKEEEDKKKKEEEDKKKASVEAEEKQKQADELAKQKEIQEEEDKRKDEESKEAADREKDDKATGRLQTPDTKPPSVELDKESSGPTNQDPLNHQDLTTTFVAGRLADKPDEVKWVDDLLKDITHKRIYIVDDPTAELHLDKNKGRESIVYLKYITEFYDNLDDITLFFHSGRKATHNNALMAQDSAVMINNLRRAYVKETGYVNVRCEHHPGCPGWITWNATKAENDLHPERSSDLFQADLWSQLFPNRTRNPVTLSQPCCSQFAASRDAIRSIPKAQYQILYDWLLTTETLDVYSGRIMEYVWQYLFLDKDEFCPDMSECYCKAYGLCMEDDTQLKKYNSVKSEIDDILHKLDDWDRARGCHEPKMTKEERQLCKKDNPWGKVLQNLRDQRMNLEGQLMKLHGIKDP